AWWTRTRSHGRSSAPTSAPARSSSPRSRSEQEPTGSPSPTAGLSGWGRASSPSCSAALPARADRGGDHVREDVAPCVEERAPHDGAGALAQPAEEQGREEDQQA